MKPWVLVYVTAKNCPACIKFNDKWPEIKKAFLSSVGAEVDIIDLTFDNMNKPVIDSTKYPLDLKRFILWFPTFVLVSSESWNAALKNTAARISGFVFNGSFTPTEQEPFPVVKQKEQRIPINGEVLAGWFRLETKPVVRPVLSQVVQQQPEVVDFCQRKPKFRSPFSANSK
jgi:hypothetical protein